MPLPLQWPRVTVESLQVVWKFPAQSKQLSYSLKVKNALLHFKGKCDLCWKMFGIHQGRKREGRERRNELTEEEEERNEAERDKKGRMDGRKERVKERE